MNATAVWLLRVLCPPTLYVITAAGVFVERYAVTTNNGKNIVFFVAHLNIIYYIYNITVLCQLGILYLVQLVNHSVFSVLATPPKAEHVSEAVFFTVLLARFRRRGAGGAPERKKCNE